MTTENTSAPAQETAAASLSLNELKGCMQVIEVCTGRGAFKPDELVAVGTLFQKLRDFVAQAEPAAEQSSQSETKEQE
ncbi:hypothetical protein UFOVP116_387 [uncultured Caudovirales phage]|uniref:Uncharacterized protein n=1 Tax=uncultured Caudovirales phage TaxID=2100421 RepID=A0A6J5L8J6_9CAUD|nr:hypothetical protein UFOVP116_387 [uncultured Caudovirales phage]